MNSSHRDRRTAELHQMQRAIAGLCLYQDLFSCEIGVALIDLLKAIASGDRSQADTLICLTAYGRFFKALATENWSWEEFIVNGILQAENPFSLQAQKTEFDRLSSCCSCCGSARSPSIGYYSSARAVYSPMDAASR